MIGCGNYRYRLYCQLVYGFLVLVFVNKLVYLPSFYIYFITYSWQWNVNIRYGSTCFQTHNLKDTSLYYRVCKKSLSISKINWIFEKQDLNLLNCFIQSIFYEQRPSMSPKSPILLKCQEQATISNNKQNILYNFLNFKFFLKQTVNLETLISG